MKDKAFYILTVFARIWGSTLFAALLFALASCTGEKLVDEGIDPPVTPDDTENRREILMTLNNKLALRSSGKRSADSRTISTADENAVSTLDVYVFGSETEDGTYTFQQRFAYRDDDSGPLPLGAEELQLSAGADADGSVTTGLLSLKRGLFVKLYCVANDTVLINPKTGRAFGAKEFVPIKFNDADGEKRIAAAGVPMEEDFLSFHTPLLKGGRKADTKDEVLLTPLAMSGAMTTPLDLTDPENSSRLQTRLRLTRLAARFDIINRAEESRFTLEQISMSNGRKGAAFFPIAVCENNPDATAGELITYTPRTFNQGDNAPANANQGTSTGAFYCYPSPEADGGYLILKGTYRINKTESKEVSYQIPFRQKNADGTETTLEINHNHRYTIGITKAEDYKLYFTLKVADWTDEGGIDDYEPENKPGELTVTIPEAFKDESEDVYDPDRKIHTVNMSLKSGSTFEAKIGAASSALTLTKTYAGGPDGRKYDWLVIEEKAPADGSIFNTAGYVYAFSLRTPYALGRYPRATVRIFDALSGDETILYVEALAAPMPVDVTQPSKAPNGTSNNPNAYDYENTAVTMYRIKNSEARVKLTCPDGLDVTKPDWLKVDLLSQEGAENTYSLTLAKRDVSGVDTGIVTFKNKNRDLSIDFTVNLLDASLKPSFESVGTDNSYTEPAADAPAIVTMAVKNGNTCSIPVTSMVGVQVKLDFGEGNPEWLTYEGAAAAPAKSATAAKKAAAAKKAGPDAARGITARAGGSFEQKEIITFSLVNDKLAGAQPVTVKLINTIQGPDSSFVIKPALQLGTMEKVSSAPVDNQISGSALTLYKLPVKASTTLVKVTSYGGSVLKSSDDTILKVEKSSAPRAVESSVTQDENTAYYRLAALKPGKVTLTHSNRSDATKTESYEVTVLASDITGDESKTLTAANGQTATFALSSYGGFTAEISNYGDADGGKLWLQTGTDFASGSQPLTVTANSTLTNVRPVTITLKNKIVDGGDKVITVVPGYVTPVASAVSGTVSPTQNTFSGTAMKLYRVSNSRMNIKVNAIGGSRIEDAKGVTVSNAAGGYNTDNTYTVTLSSTSTTSGSFKIVNKSDDSKWATVNVTGADASITASATNNVSAKANNGTDNITVSSPEGCTASVTGWGSGGGSWFSFTKNSVEAGNSKFFTIRQPTGNTGVVMKPVTVKLTNAIAGGPSKDITITPTGFVAPTLTSAVTDIGQPVNVNSNFNGTLTVTAPAGGWEYVSNSNSAVATVSASGTTYTIKPLTKGSTTLTFRNKSDNSKTATKAFTVVYPTFNGGTIFKTTQASGGTYYIAMQDAATAVQWSASLDATYCANKPGGSWHVPSADEWRAILGGTSGSGDASAAVFNELNTNKVFSVGLRYWSSSEYSSSEAYCLFFFNSRTNVRYDAMVLRGYVLCVSRP